MGISEWARSNPALSKRLEPLGTSKLDILSRLGTDRVRALLERDRYDVPEGPSVTLRQLSVRQLRKLIAATSEEIQHHAARHKLIKGIDSRVRLLDKASYMVAEFADEIDRDKAADWHDALLAAAGRIADAFDLDE